MTRILYATSVRYARNYLRNWFWFVFAIWCIEKNRKERS
jgi:hypothetical protein